jgi:serine/threonine-protein kinase HipA
MRLDELHLWYLGDPDRPALVGRLRLVEAGKGVSLQYAASWLNSGFALSEDLPLRDVEQLPRWKGMAVGAVDDARPDRWGEQVIRFIDKPARVSLMELLFYAGDDRFGALGVSLSATTYEPRPRGPLPRLESAQQLSEVVHKVAEKAAISQAEAAMLAAGGSFGGAKPKTLIEIDGEQWLIKFFNGEPIDVPLVEHASMTLAAHAGIQVAETRVVRLRGENALAVRRYDRVGRQRIHCVSAGTALRAVAASEPELGYPDLALLLRRAGVDDADRRLADMHELFRRMVFNILIDNTDDHEKNHALMVVAPGRHGRVQLAPAYDVLPTNSGQGHQEFIVGDEMRASTLSNAMSRAADFGLTPAQAAAEVARVIEVVAGWRAHFAALGVCEADLDSLAERIDGDALRGQRLAFDAASHVSAGLASQGKRPKRSPFGRA